MKAQELLEKAFVDLQEIVVELTIRERDDLRRELEGLSVRAGEVAGYLDERHGHGCGDQGHNSAVKQLNRNGKIIWTKAFGYNAYHRVSF